jgi:lipoprotein-releasing system ATP-binding protein
MSAPVSPAASPPAAGSTAAGSTASGTISAPRAPAPRREAGQPLVTVRSLFKSFQHMGNVLEVLKGIDLEIQRGELLSIVGASGAGKSTLLHCIGTLDLPTSGQIMLDGIELTTLSGPKLARVRNQSIGFVFQFHHLLPEFDALENVMMPGLIRGDTRKQMEQRARDLLAEVGLSHRVTHRPGEMSGGEQQRVAIARALTLEPKLLLADEPTGNLDTATSDSIHDLFFEINQKHNTTIVVVTHNPSFAQRMPRVVEMMDGKVLRDVRGTLSLDRREE